MVDEGKTVGLNTLGPEKYALVVSDYDHNRKVATVEVEPKYVDGNSGKEIGRLKATKKDLAFLAGVADGKRLNVDEGALHNCPADRLEKYVDRVKILSARARRKRAASQSEADVAQGIAKELNEAD